MDCLMDCSYSKCKANILYSLLQLDLLQLVPTDWADYRTEYNIIAANCSAVRYFVAPSKLSNDQVYLLKLSISRSLPQNGSSRPAGANKLSD